MEFNLSDIPSYFGANWVAWSVVVGTAFAYALMTLALRAAEPRELLEKLGMEHGESSDKSSDEVVLDYRSMRLVLTTFRTAAAMVSVMAAMAVAESLGFELTVWTFLVLGAVMLVGLLGMRMVLNRVADKSLDRIRTFVSVFIWIAEGLGRIVPGRRWVTNTPVREESEDEESGSLSDALAVVSTLASDGRIMREFMTARADVVAVPSSLNLGELHQLFLREGMEYVVVYEGSLDHALGIVRRSDVFELILGEGTDSGALKSILRPKLVLSETQQLAAVLKEFRDREDETGLVEDEHGRFVGTLTFSQLARRVMTNGNGNGNGDG